MQPCWGEVKCPCLARELPGSFRSAALAEPRRHLREPTPPQACVFDGKCRPWHGRFVRSTHPSTETRCYFKATEPRPPARPGSATFFSSPPPLFIRDPLRLPRTSLSTHVHPLPAPAYSPLRTAASLAATRPAGPCSLSTFLKQPLMRQATAPAHRRPCYNPPGCGRCSSSKFKQGDSFGSSGGIHSGISHSKNRRSTAIKIKRTQQLDRVSLGGLKKNVRLLISIPNRYGLINGAHDTSPIQRVSVVEQKVRPAVSLITTADLWSQVTPSSCAVSCRWLDE